MMQEVWESKKDVAATKEVTRTGGGGKGRELVHLERLFHVH